ncbi:MAG: molybdate ABC transporter substrate-binding protein [Dethiobacter sp.]|nr:MAG: molybdate ABC transporter substrate-binding protein [Dethiobacter sp.]
MRFKLYLLLILIVAIMLQGTGCKEKDSSGNPSKNEITVAAASDLCFAFEEIGASYEEKTGTKVVFLFGSSGLLARQIAHGAPVDVFASANKGFIEELILSGNLIGETAEIYALGRIVLAVNNRTGLQVNSLEDLISGEIDRIAIANPTHAPYGMAAEEALRKAGIWEDIKDKLVYGENIFQVLQFIQTGNVPAGIIALSIARVPEINYILIDESFYTPLEQMLAVVNDSPNLDTSMDFARFVISSEGRVIMEKYGFKLP